MLDNEQLVMLITKEVINKLKSVNGNGSDNKKKVLVLENKEILCDGLISSIQAKNYVVDCLDNMECLNEYECIIVQNLSNGELSRISLGIEGTFKEKTIIKALLLGKVVYVLEYGVEYKKNDEISNKAFYNVFKCYEDKLKSYGFKFVSHDELLNCIENNNKCTVSPSENCNVSLTANSEKNNDEKSYEFVDMTNKKLISEVELKNVFKIGITNVLVSKKCIMTPLAKDYVRINNLQISRK